MAIPPHSLVDPLQGDQTFQLLPCLTQEHDTEAISRSNRQLMRAHTWRGLRQALQQSWWWPGPQQEMCLSYSRALSACSCVVCHVDRRHDMQISSQRCTQLIERGASRQGREEGSEPAGRHKSNWEACSSQRFVGHSGPAEDRQGLRTSASNPTLAAVHMRRFTLAWATYMLRALTSAWTP